MDKFNSIEKTEEPIISKDIIFIMDNLLNRIVISIGYAINHFSNLPEEKSTQILEKFLGLNHAICTDLLKKMIDRFPSLLIHVLEFSVSMEPIKKYYKSLPSLFESMEEKYKSNNDRLSFIDFLWLTYPYIGPISEQILSHLLKKNYYFRFVNGEDNKILCSSSTLWKYELLSRCIAEFKRLIESKNIFKDLNTFLQFQSLILLTTALFVQNKSFSKNLIHFDEKINQELYEICIFILNEYNEDLYLPFLKIDNAFFTLFKKVHNRIVRTSIVKKKNSKYEKKDMQYYK